MLELFSEARAGFRRRVLILTIDPTTPPKHGNHVIARDVVQYKTREPVRFELIDHTREAVHVWIKEAALSSADDLFPSRQSGSPHLSALRNGAALD